MFDQIRADIFRYHTYSERLDSKVRLFWNTPGLQALITYRMGSWLRHAGRCTLCWPLVLALMPIYLLLTAYVRLAFDIHLSQSACIGPGLYIGHFGGIRVRNCRLGEYCSIQQEVCLEPEMGSDRGPEIGNRVWIGAHARILGDFRVGSRATISAGAVVTQDVIEGCLVAGNPARVVFKTYDNSRLL